MNAAGEAGEINFVDVTGTALCATEYLCLGDAGLQFVNYGLRPTYQGKILQVDGDDGCSFRHSPVTYCVGRLPRLPMPGVAGQIFLTVLVRDSPACLPIRLRVSSVTAPTCRPRESRLLHLPRQSGEAPRATGAIHLRCSDSEQSVSKRACRTNEAARTGHSSRGTSFMGPHYGPTGGREIEQGNIVK